MEIWAKVTNFSVPVYLMPPLMGFPLELWNDGKAQKARMMPLQECQKA